MLIDYFLQDSNWSIWLSFSGRKNPKGTGKRIS